MLNSLISIAVMAQSSNVNIIPNMDSSKQIPYLVLAGLLALTVLIGISMMSKVNRAVAGNLLGSVSMALAIGLTLWAFDIFSVVDLWVAMLIGTILGLILSRKVTMLQMPQMVGLLNGFGGGASMIAGALTLINPGGEDPFSLITSGLAIYVGALTLTGSIVAAGKLHQVFTQKPIVLKGHQFWTIATALLGFVSAILFVHPAFQSGAAKIILILVCAVISGAFGVIFSIRVGGADMPITISLLNSFSGVAGGIAGLAISDPLLVAVGGIVGASGLLLTQIMCRAMNRKLTDILLGKTSTPMIKKATKGTAPAVISDPASTATADDAAVEFTDEGAQEAPAALETKEDPHLDWLKEARRVIIVPGYGMALSQAQEQVKQLMLLLESQGAEVDFAIHPVAGRMPGHMNVLLAEVDIPYDKLREMEEINDQFKNADLAIIIGANDVVNPAANTAVGTPIYGMPILAVEDAGHLIIMNFDRQPGYAGVDNPLDDESADKVALLLGDAKASLEEIFARLADR